MAIGDVVNQIFAGAATRQPASGDGERCMLLKTSGGYSDGNMPSMYDGSTNVNLGTNASGNHMALGTFTDPTTLRVTNSVYINKAGDGDRDVIYSGIQIDD